MKKAKLAIGDKHNTVYVQCDVAETTQDVEKLAKQFAKTESDRYVVACFNRAHRINLQEKSGARDFVRESKLEDRKNVEAFAAKVQSIVDTFDYTEKRTRNASSVKEINVAVEKSATDAEKMAAMKQALLAAGITINM